MKIFSIILCFFLSVVLFNCGDGKEAFIPIREISINEKESDFFITGDTFAFTLSYKPVGGKIESENKWLVLNKDVAAINNSGVLTALKPGNTKIKVYNGNLYDILEIQIRNVPDGYVRLHYYNESVNYNDIGLVLSGDAVVNDIYSFVIDGQHYSINNPLMLSSNNNTDFGIYIDIPVLPGVQGLTVDFGKTDYQKNEYVPIHSNILNNLNKYNEFWIYNNSSYIDKPDTNNIISEINIESIYDILNPGDTINLNTHIFPNNIEVKNSLKWQSSNIEVGKVNDLGIFTATGTGVSTLKCFANGLVNSIEIYVVPNVSNNYKRIYYHQYNGNYNDIFIVVNNVLSGIYNKKFHFTGMSNFGKYVDIPKYNDNSITEITIRNNDNIFSTSEITNNSNDNEYFLKQGSSNISTKNDMNVGAVKIANSWGKGGHENIDDGFFYMSYDLLKKLNTSIWFLMPDEHYIEYEPKALAVFSIEHPIRNEVRVSIGVGDYENPDKTKNFRGYMRLHTTAPVWGEEIDTNPWSDTKIALDITEFFPFENDNDTVFIRVYDVGDSDATGFLNSFSIELYNNYNDSPVEIYSADTIPVATINNENVYKSIPDVSSQSIIAASPLYPYYSLSPLKISSRATVESDRKKLHINNLNTTYYNIPNNNISDNNISDNNISDNNIPDNNISDNNISDNNIPDNNISDYNISDYNISDYNISDYNISDYNISTGLRMPDDNEWEKILAENRLRYVTDINNIFYSSQLPKSFDNAESPHFPPIGDQYRKGSCASWASGYYMAGFYAARKYNWDFTFADEIDWRKNEVPSELQGKLMSADFLYNLLNGGVDWGSFFYDPYTIISEIGISSLKTMPILPGDVTSWPSEEAWREAPRHRVNYDKNYYWFVIRDAADIEKLKTLLKSGYVVNIAYNSLNWRYYSNNDTLTTQNYFLFGNNHAVTITGYFDEWQKK